MKVIFVNKIRATPFSNIFYGKKRYTNLAGNARLKIAAGHQIGDKLTLPEQHYFDKKVFNLELLILL